MSLSFSVRLGQIAQLSNRRFAVVTLKQPHKPLERVHTTLILDCSGSMSPYIRDVADDSKKFISTLPDGETVSVVVFSGHDEAEIIAAGVKIDPDGRLMLQRVIDREVRVRSVTVFSEPLALTLMNLQRFTGDDTANNAILFTDGCAVPTRWDLETEQTNAYRVASDLKNFGAVVSVIGYGVYYDTNFINRLMAAAGNTGVYEHIRDIDGFGEAIKQVREIFLETYPADLVLTIQPKSGSAGKIYRMLPAVLAFGKDGHGATRGLFKGEATFFVELTQDSPNGIDLFGSIDGESLSQSFPAEAATDEDKATFVRVLAADAALQGNSQMAAELAALVGDNDFADVAAESHTEDERRQTGNDARFYFLNRRFIGAGLKPTGPNHCLLNVLRLLVEDPRNVIQIPQGMYKRSGELTVDPAVIHPKGRVLKVTGVRSKDTRFNFSIMALKDVKVLLRDDAGNVIDDSVPVDRKIWRTYNIILDGNLHLPTLEASLSRESFDTLLEAGVIATGTEYQANRSYTLDLRAVKMVSSAWAHPGTLGLVPLLTEEAELEEEQTALNARLKALGAVSKAGTEDGDTYHEKAKKDEKAVKEYYKAACCEWKLMGYKSAEDYAAQAAKLDFDAATTRVKEVRSRLITVRFLSRTVVYACEITGNRTVRWGQVKETARGKNAKKEQLAEYNGTKLKRVVWTEEVVCS